MTALHFYIQFKEKQTENASSKEIEVPEKNDTPLSSPIPNEHENRPVEPTNSEQRETETNWDELYETLNKENPEKQEQQRLLAEMMKNDKEAGLYDTGDLLNKNKQTKDNQGDKKNINKSKSLTDMQVSKGSSRPPKNWG